jgi:hypothetical protein
MLQDYDGLDCCPNITQLSPSLPAFNEQEVTRAEKLQRKHGIEVLDASGNDLRVIVNFICLIIYLFHIINFSPYIERYSIYCTGFAS